MPMSFSCASVKDKLLSPIFLDMGQEWAEARMAGPGVLPFAKVYQQQPSSSSSSSSWYPMTTHVEQHLSPEQSLIGIVRDRESLLPNSQ